MSGTTARIVRPGAALTTAQTTAGATGVAALDAGGATYFLDGTVRGFGSIENQGFVRTLPAALANLENGAAEIRSVLMIGDSWIGQNGITNPIREYLQSQFGRAGFGYVSFYDQANVNSLLTSTFTVSRAGSWSNDASSANPGPDSVSVTSSTAGNTITLVASDVTGFRLIFARKSGGGVFSWSVNGGSATNVDTSAGTLGPDIVTITGLTAGSNTLLITVVSGSVSINGATLDKGTTGVQVHRCGLSGSNTGVWRNSDLTKWASAVALLAPSLVTITLCVNDSGGVINAAAARANLSLMVDALRAALPLVDIVFLPPADVANASGVPNYPTGDTINDYAEAQRSLAVEKLCGFVPVHKYFGTAVESVDRGTFQPADYRHPSTAGGRVIARLLLEYILPGRRVAFDAYAAGDNFMLPDRGGRITVGHNNTGIGARNGQGGVQALSNVTSGTYNVALGSSALSGLTTGRYCVAVGFEAGRIFNGDALVAIGHQALALATGNGNVGIGFQSMPALTTGTFNVGIGAGALNSVVSTANNTAIGAAALQSATGANNTGVGRYAAYLSTGAGNTAVGSATGNVNTTGSNNTWIGTFADSTANNLSRAVAIGYNARVSASNSCAIGGAGVDALKLGVDGVAAPTASIDAGGDTIRLRTARTPASASAAGNAGDVCWDASFIYVCVAANTWRRIAHATW